MSEVKVTVFAPLTLAEKFPQYHKSCPFERIDVYRILSLFEVTDPCLQHALKKVLVAGGRGGKDISKDIQEAIDSLVRWQEMRREEIVVNILQVKDR
jgi:hypothetical protein